MIGGIKVGDAARRAAEELLERRSDTVHAKRATAP
jgi:hypothetical protein